MRFLWCRSRVPAALAVSAALLPVLVIGGTRQKVDVIFLKNGDRITCEIKKLEYGQLTVKAPYAKGDFTINWAEVEKVESPQPFVVETVGGLYYEGTIRTDQSKSENLEVRSGLTPVSLPQEQIVRVGQFGRGFRDRIKFAIDYGFTYTRSNQQTQSTLHLDTNYRTAKIYTGGSIDSLFSSQEESTTDTNRHQGSLFYYRRIYGSEWYAGSFGSFLTNNQQDLNLRVTGGGGVLRNVFTTNRHSLLASAGIVYSNEKYSVPDAEGRSRFSSAEASIGARYSMFRFDNTDFLVEFNIYPSLTQPGRVRSDSNVSLYIKLVRDLYTRFGFYSNFDSQPPANTARNDYGVSTSIGWSF